MFWADTHLTRIKERFQKEIAASKALVIRDEKTASGRVHIGSMRGVAVHGTVAQLLAQQDVPVVFKYEINDMDPMDGIPAELPEAVWGQYLGRALKDIPSPDGIAENFAEFYAAEFKTVIAEAGFTPEYYRVSELYASGGMDAAIKMALEKAADIRRIYKQISGSDKKEDWLPISMMCEQCGKVGTTHAHHFDGTQVHYRCIAGAGGAQGCGFEGAGEPWGGKAKFPWKVDWPAKWFALGVHIEGAGKDHSTKGGARDVANAIAKEVFGIEPPYDMPYEFFLDKEGKKMSSSKGRGVSSREIADNFPPAILRLALLGKDPNQQTSIDPDGELLATLYDWHDKIAEKFWDGVNDDDARLFEVLYHGAPPARMYLPRFSVVTFVSQMKHLDPIAEFATLKGEGLTDVEERELIERITFAQRWLSTYAPERYRFALQDTLPEAARALSEAQKEALRDIFNYVEAHESIDGPGLHAALHDIKTKRNMAPKELFSALYLTFLGRESGPQAGWFLSTMPREFLVQRLSEALAGV